jgi:hypothetical protein
MLTRSGLVVLKSQSGNIHRNQSNSSNTHKEQKADVGVEEEEGHAFGMKYIVLTPAANKENIQRKKNIHPLAGKQGVSSLTDDDEETVIENYEDRGTSNNTFGRQSSKHHPLLGVVATMINGGVYLHCECGHVRRVEEQWACTVVLDGPGFVDQMKGCPHSLYRRTNSFKKMKLHIKKCKSKVEGGRADEKDLPPFFQRTYNNKIIK